MTVNSSVASGKYNGDGVSVAFPILFYFLANSHISATTFVVSNGVATPLILGTDYTVSGAGVQTGGLLTLTVPLLVGSSLYFARNVPIDQQIDYTPNDKFPAEVTESGFDKLTMIAQELDAGRGHTLRYADYEDIDGQLPAPLQRAGTILSWDGQGSPIYVPVPPNVGAGDLRNEVWVDGTDYTAGTTTTLTLSRLYGTKANLGSVVMQGIAQDPRSYLLNGLQLVFDAPIPLGASSVWCTGGTTLSIDGNTAGSVKLSANGIDDTRNFQLACLLAQEIEFVGTGPFFLGLATVPASVKSWFSKSGAVIKPSSAVPVGAAFSTWITASGLKSAEISGLEFQAPSATYGGLTVFQAAACTDTVLRRLITNGSGYTGISSIVGVNNKVLDCKAIDYKGNGIQVSGSSLAVLDLGTEVTGCYTQGNGPLSVAHGVSVIFGLDFNVHHNKSVTAGTFGFDAAFCEGGIFAGNTSYNTTHEGLNVEDSNHIKVHGNIARWDAGGGPGIDFGMSFLGNTRNCFGLEILDNQIINSASSGLCFAGSASFGVQHSPVRGNLVFNCNSKKAAVAGGADNLAGILLSATLCEANPIAGNTVIDIIGTLTYGIAELDFGTGLPSSNEITSNRTFGSFVGGAPIHAGSASTKTALNTPQL